MSRIIPAAILFVTLCFGQVAGTAAAKALASGVSVRDVDIKALQKDLRDQGVILPSL